MGDDYEARARALWDAYTRGDMESACALVDDEIDWRISTGERLHGPAEVAAYLRGNADMLQAVAHTFECDGDRVIVHGSLRRFRDSGFVDMQPTWVFRFRGGRLYGVTSHESREAAWSDARRRDT